VTRGYVTQCVKTSPTYVSHFFCEFIDGVKTIVTEVHRCWQMTAEIEVVVVCMLYSYCP